MSSCTIIADAETLVKTHMAAYDPSHDWFHVDRVRRTALRLARALKEDEVEEKGMDLEVVELVALFHDLAAKYTTPGSLSHTLSPFFTLHPLPSSTQNLILQLIPLISWSKEKTLRASDQWDAQVDRIRALGGWGVLRCVQDGDRLDAIGAFGILRVAAYSSAVNRPLYVPARSSTSSNHSNSADPDTHQKEEEEERKTYQKLADGSSIQHFHDKLLLIKDRLKTPLGKKEGVKRHETMVRFLADIEDEFAQ